jgi:hypothetical protein
MGGDTVKRIATFVLFLGLWALAEFLRRTFNP